MSIGLKKKMRIFWGGVSKKIGLIAILKYFLLYLSYCRETGGLLFLPYYKDERLFWGYNGTPQEKKYTCLGKKSSRF